MIKFRSRNSEAALPKRGFFQSSLNTITSCRSEAASLASGLLLIVVTGATMVRAETPLPIEKADVLPLALTDDFEFRKFEIFKNAAPVPGATPIPTRDLMIDFERKHRLWGAIDGSDVAAKTGQYFVFVWRSKRPASVTLEAKGNHTSEFAIVGNDYEVDGPITSWRAILIEDRKIVGLLQSRTWR
jgi:hypothetical protein